jgi:hypothetical protein
VSDLYFVDPCFGPIDRVVVLPELFTIVEGLERELGHLVSPYRLLSRSPTTKRPVNRLVAGVRSRGFFVGLAAAENLLWPGIRDRIVHGFVHAPGRRLSRSDCVPFGPLALSSLEASSAVTVPLKGRSDILPRSSFTHRP